MRLSAQRVLIATLFLLGTRLVAAEAQTQYPNVKVTGRLQEQFYYFDNSDYASSVGPERQHLHSPGPDRGARQHLRKRRAVHPAVLRRWPDHQLHDDLYFDRVPAGGGTPTITCRTTSRGGIRLRDAWIDVRLANEANKTDYLHPGGPGKEADEPLRADLVGQPAVD